MTRAREKNVGLLMGGIGTVFAVSPVYPAELGTNPEVVLTGTNGVPDGLFYGLLLGIGIYYLFLYLGARFSRFGWFALYVLTLVGYTAVQSQELYNWLGWVEPPTGHWLVMQVLLSTCTAASIQFGRRFLILATHCPKWDWRLRWLNYLNLLFILGMLVVPFPQAVETAHLVLVLAITLILFVLAVFRGRQGQRSAWFYVAAFGTITLGIWLDALNYYTSSPLFGENAMMDWIFRHSYRGGIIGEVFLMAFALAASINEIRRARDSARAEALTNAAETATIKDHYARDLKAELETRTAEVKHQNALLVERDHLKSRFFANISHELRTPLSLVQGHATDLRKHRYGEIAAKGDSALDQLLHQTRRIEGRIGELLDLSKLEAGQLRLHTRATDLHKFVSAQAESFQNLCADKQIKLIVSPATETLPGVYIDEEKFQQIIGNLLSNAVKFTPAKGEIRIEILKPTKTTPDDGRDRLVGIAVTDTGTGIDPEAITQVFERYYRDDGPRSINHNGSGIGLALVRELTELHGGFVEVESQMGSGSCFRIWVPIGHDHLQESEILPPAADAQSATPIFPETPTSTAPVPAAPNNAPLILLVEDHAELRHWIHDHLAIDYRVLEAANGDIGLNLARRHRPDLILSDVMMPGRDGLELLQAIRTDPALGRTPCILLTASGDSRIKFAGLQARANDYLTKPVQMAELKQRINNLLELQIPHPVESTPDASSDLPDSPLTAESRMLARLRQACESKLANPDFHVADLAAAMSMSEATLRRQIDGLIDRPVGQWIRQVRLNRARTLITGRSLQTVSEVAFAVGFRSPSYFSRLYTAEFGTSPLAMLKMQT